MDVRPAATDELPAVATVLDAAMLATDDLRARLEAGDVLVALEGARVLGALVLEPRERAPGWVRERDAAAHVAAVAVRRRRRDQGIGSALVRAAGDRGRLAAGFDPSLRGFYEGLGFSVVATDEDGRLRAVRDS